MEWTSLTWSALAARIACIALGGGLGATARYLTAEWLQHRFGTVARFPIGTLSVNVCGCLLIGVLTVPLTRQGVPENLKLAIIAGLLGGLTTFSTFSLETISLARESMSLKAVLYVMLTNCFCLLAAWGGYRFTERWWRA